MVRHTLSIESIDTHGAKCSTRHLLDPAPPIDAFSIGDEARTASITVTVEPGSPRSVSVDPTTSALRDIRKGASTVVHILVQTAETATTPQSIIFTTFSGTVVHRHAGQVDVGQSISSSILGGTLAGNTFRVPEFANVTSGKHYLLSAHGSNAIGWKAESIVPCNEDGSIELNGTKVSSTSLGLAYGGVQ